MKMKFTSSSLHIRQWGRPAESGTQIAPPPLANIRKVPQSTLVRAHVCREAF